MSNRDPYRRDVHDWKNIIFGQGWVGDLVAVVSFTLTALAFWILFSLFSG